MKKYCKKARSENKKKSSKLEKVKRNVDKSEKISKINNLNKKIASLKKIVK